MTNKDTRKQSIYMPLTLLEELNAEGERLKRPISWLVQRCVRVGLSELKTLKTVHEPGGPRAESES
jgi:uncharacterized small protein (TIGR04563 family)